MKKILVLICVCFLYNCSTNDNSTIPDINKEAVISGTLKIVDYTKFPEIKDPNLPSIKSNSNWELGSNSELTLKVSKNLTSNPYNIKLNIDVDKTNPDSPKLSFISDFDRKITVGDRYRLISTINLFSSTSFIPGNTGGQVKFVEYNDAFGFSIGSELEMTIADTGSKIPGSNYSQKLVLIGTFTPDNNNGAGFTLGNFNIVIEGDNIIDTTIF